MPALIDIAKKGSTNRAVTLLIVDSTTGLPETGVVFNTAGIDLWYRRESGALVSITEATLASLTTAHADGGFLHISDGSYRVDLPDAAYATGANHFDVGGTVTGMVVIGGRVRLVDYDPEDSVRMGMTALPNAAADSAGGLAISDAGGLDMDATDTNVSAIITDLDNATDGLGALKALIDTVNTDLANGTDGLGALKTLIDTVNTDLSNGTDGLGALKTLIDTVNTDLSNGTDGLGALKTLIDAIKVITDAITTTGTGLTNIPWNASWDAEVESEVNDAINTAVTELPQGVPTATPTLRTGMMLSYMQLRNKLDITATLKEIHNDAGAVITKKTLSDDGTTYSEAEAVSGP